MRERHSMNPFDLMKRNIKNWLLPYPFKVVGMVLLLLLLVALAAEILFRVDAVYGDVVTSPFPSVIHRAECIALYLAMFLLSCSRERNEDEMTAALRGETLKEVCYFVLLIWVVYRIVVACVSQELFYVVHDEPLVTPFVVWVLYFARFESKLKKLRQENRRFTL